jgi:hypothetical protein
LTSFAKLVKEDTQSSVRVVSTVPMDHAEISRDGLRAVDSGMFTCPSRIAANIGDEYKYIQDIADSTHLRGAYLFQGSCLDESGYNNDPVNQTHGAISGFNDYDGLDYTLTTATNKFKGFYGATATSNGKGAIIPNKFLKDGTTNILDFSGDFDIFCWVEPEDGEQGGVIFSKINSSDEGITIKLSSNSNGFSASATIENTTSGVGSKSFSTQGGDGGTASYIQGDEPCLVRLQRKGITFNLWLVNGSENIPFGAPNATYTGTVSYPKSSGSFSVPTDATIGSKASSFSSNTVTNTGSKFEGKLYSIRIYSNVLDSTSAQQIFSSRPVPLIMKLAGTVWKIESSIDQKKIYVKGFGKVIIDTLVSAQLLTSGTVTGEYYQYSGSRTLTAFTNATPIEIIRAIFAKLNVSMNRTLSSSLSFTLGVRDLTTVSNVINSYKAEGNFLEIIDQLMTIVDKSFYVSPRGKCIIENQEIDLTNNLKFGKKYNISADGFDDTLTVNDLYVSTRAGGNFNIIHADEVPSINLIGIYSKRILAPQITDATAATNFMNKFITKHKDINSRYTIVAPALIDFVRENFKVKVTNTTKNLDVNSTIKSITWTYPEGRTTIETGDFLLDAFDIEKTSAEAIQNLVTDTNLNP